jgi:hypothetical protein
MGGRFSSEQLAIELESSRSKWEPFLAIGKARADQYLARIRLIDGTFAERGEVHDEQIWTFLGTVGYAAGGEVGVHSFTELVLGRMAPELDHPRIWLEVLPMSPRLGEGSTNVDIAIGSIEWRPGTTGGIQLAEVSEPWVCLVEGKWYSDIDTKVTGHPERNQLARVAENAVCFQRSGTFAKDATVALLTPARFKDSRGTSRFYRYKFRAYSEDFQELVGDWREIDDILNPREQKGWTYPTDVDRRAGLLDWVWPTYEELLSPSNLPETGLEELLVDFENRWNGTRRMENGVG